jgi:hypothetical protein
MRACISTETGDSTIYEEEFNVRKLSFEFTGTKAHPNLCRRVSAIYHCSAARSQILDSLVEGSGTLAVQSGKILIFEPCDPTSHLGF